MKNARIIIADDHLVVRQGLRNILELAPGLEVVADAADGETAERLAREVPAELLILDIALPVRGGMQVLEALRAGGSALPVLLFSMHPPSQYVAYARRKGAQGFVGKDAPAAELLRAVRRVLGGGTSFPNASRDAAPAADPFAALSRREADVARGLLRGDSLESIAERLGVGAKSASTYRRRLLDKLGLRGNADLVALATRLDYS